MAKAVRAWGRTAALGLISLCASVACSVPTTHFHAGPEYPARLSEWGVIQKAGNSVQLAQDALVYALNEPLFSDYAQKLRTVHLPSGQSLQFDEFDHFAAPDGTVISKTFFYYVDAQGRVDLTRQWSGDPGAIDLNEVRLVETRLLVKDAGAWVALPYVWQGEDAYLEVTGNLQEVLGQSGEAFSYLVPSRNQCAGCHATNHSDGALRPIGVKARHLHRDSPVTAQNQLAEWQERGWLQGLPELAAVRANAARNDRGANLSHRARSYLDINCGHCHNAVGAADTSGLLLDYADHPLPALGWCKHPIAAGRGTGGFAFGIAPGAPERSILTFRMRSSDPAVMMPELGRALVDHEGADLVGRWIATLPGDCS